MMQGNHSDVARVRQEIEAICFSMNLAFHGFDDLSNYALIETQFSEYTCTSFGVTTWGVKP